MDSHLIGLLTALATKAQYCEDYNFSREEEYEAEWMQFRLSLMKTFKKVVQYKPDISAQFVVTAVQGAIANHKGLPWRQVSDSITLMRIPLNSTLHHRLKQLYICYILWARQFQVGMFPSHSGL